MVKRPRAPTNPLERANRETDETFMAQYLTLTFVPRQYGNAEIAVDSDVANRAHEASPWTTSWTHPRTEQRYSISLLQAGSLSDEDLEACFELIAETSQHDYESSSIGWHPAKKRKEMRSPELRYILVKDYAGSLRGFTSFMPTWEEGEPVVYCYEIHLKPELQGWVPLFLNLLLTGESPGCLLTKRCAGRDSENC